MNRKQIASLLRPDAYPERPEGVGLLQTHVSWIFLTGDHAYKIKKPVDFGFLNFTTLDRRRFYCNEEVRLNRRLCPDMYEGVVEVRSDGENAWFDGKGTIIDYAVKMKQLPGERMLARLVENGSITVEPLLEVARTIASFHKKAESSPSTAEFGSPSRLRFNWQETIDQSECFAGDTVSLPALNAIKSWADSFFLEKNDVIRRRVDEGFVRECDGDIHLENINISDKIYIFDCIEFNDRFRYCDTASDLAFLLMDLDYHNRRDLSEVVLSEYIATSGDRNIKEVIDFYKTYRALVRGKVESLRSADSGIAESDRQISRQHAASYYGLARGYMVKELLPPTLFITCGPMGCGKSTLAACLSYELGISVWISDSERKRIFGPDISADELYSGKSTEATYRRLLELAAPELASGKPVIIDASFVKKTYRLPFKAAADMVGCRFVIIQMDCPVNENISRLRKRVESAIPSVSDGRPELLEKHLDIFEPPTPDEGIIVKTDFRLSPREQAEQVYSAIGRRA